MARLLSLRCFLKYYSSVILSVILLLLFIQLPCDTLTVVTHTDPGDWTLTDE